MHSSKPTRRELLGAVSGSIVLAGCLGDDTDNGSDGEGDDENSGGSDPDDENETENTGDGADDETGAETDSGTENGSDEDGDDGGQEAEAVVQVTDTSDYGEILVGHDGHTLYMFDADERGTESSTCYDGCAENWPPLTVDSDPTAGTDVEADLSTFERENGARQVTANGWPLYYWANDESPGDTTGQGVNDVWWVLDSDGDPIRASSEDTPSEDEGAENDDGDGDDSGGGGDDSENGDGNGGGYGGGYDN